MKKKIVNKWNLKKLMPKFQKFLQSKWKTKITKIIYHNLLIRKIKSFQKKIKNNYKLILKRKKNSKD